MEDNTTGKYLGVKNKVEAGERKYFIFLVELILKWLCINQVFAANLWSPMGSSPSPLIPDWHTISLSTLIRDQILDSPDNALAPGHPDTRSHSPLIGWLLVTWHDLASDWPAEECHMSQVTYLECVTESGRTAHNLAFFVSCQLSGDINTGDSQIHCCNASLSPLLVHWKRWENGFHSFILSKI